MTITQLINITNAELHSMTTQELIEVAREAAKKSAKRARSIEVHNLEQDSRPYKTLMQEGGYHFRLSDIRKNADGTYNRYDITRFINSQQSYLGTQTGTYKGYVKWERSVESALGNRRGMEWYQDATIEQRRRFWNQYHEVQDEILKNYKYADALSTFTQIFMEEEESPEERTPEQALAWIQDRIDQLRLERQREQASQLRSFT